MQRRLWIFDRARLATLIVFALCSSAAAALPEVVVGASGADPSAMASLDAVAGGILDDGCAQHLLDRDAHSFAEAQVACDAFASFALVNRTIAAGRTVARPPDREMLVRLLDDALSSRAASVFERGGMTMVGSRSLPRSALYRGFVALMMSGMQRVGALDHEGLALYDDLAASLVHDYGRHEFLASFGSAIWPCDNALAASALTLHGRQRGNSASASAARRLVDRLERLRRRRGGFPTRIGPDGEIIEGLTRGTALAWTVAFLGMGNRPAAEPFAKDLLRRFCDRRRLLGSMMAACREWPRGVSLAADSASGPIIQGYGVGASALAIAATRVVRADDWHQALLRSGYRAGLGAIVARPQKYPLENAILHWGRSQRSW